MARTLGEIVEFETTGQSTAMHDMAAADLQRCAACVTQISSKSKEIVRNDTALACVAATPKPESVWTVIHHSQHRPLHQDTELLGRHGWIDDPDAGAEGRVDDCVGGHVDGLDADGFDDRNLGLNLALDDDALLGLAGGRGAMPLALALLAGTLGSGHALPWLDPSSLESVEWLNGGGSRRAHGLQPHWDDHALPLIRQFEGLALEAYLDPVGIPTIGYGTIRYPDGKPVQLGDRITAVRAEQLLRDAVAEHYAPALLAAIPPAHDYTAAQQAALLSFTYNVGVGSVQRSTLRRRLLAGEDPQLVIAEELPRWSRGGGRELPGLVRRRAAEVALFVEAGRS